MAVLEANRCGIGPEGAERLQQIFQNGGQLGSLAIRENCIGDEGVDAIGKGLQAGAVLEALDLGKNQVRSITSSRLIENTLILHPNFPQPWAQQDWL